MARIEKSDPPAAAVPKVFFLPLQYHAQAQVRNRIVYLASEKSLSSTKAPLLSVVGYCEFSGSEMFCPRVHAAIMLERNKQRRGLIQPIMCKIGALIFSVDSELGSIPKRSALPPNRRAKLTKSIDSRTTLSSTPAFDFAIRRTSVFAATFLFFMRPPIPMVPTYPTYAANRSPQS